MKNEDFSGQTLFDRIQGIARGNLAIPEFLARMEKLYGADSDAYRSIERAIYLCRRKFKDKWRVRGEPYVEHLMAVALFVELFWQPRVAPLHIVLAAIQHDTIEDTDLSFGDLRRMFGLRVAVVVWCVSKPKRLWATEPYVLRIVIRYWAKLTLLAFVAPRMVALIKICDRMHNLLTLWPQNTAKQKRNLWESKVFYKWLSKFYRIFPQEFAEAIEVAERMFEFQTSLGELD